MGYFSIREHNTRTDEERTTQGQTKKGQHGTPVGACSRRSCARLVTSNSTSPASAHQYQSTLWSTLGKYLKKNMLYIKLILKWETFGKILYFLINHLKNKLYIKHVILLHNMLYVKYIDIW